jgi:hypothetical protein
MVSLGVQIVFMGYKTWLGCVPIVHRDFIHTVDLYSKFYNTNFFSNFYKTKLVIKQPHPIVVTLDSLVDVYCICAPQVPLRRTIGFIVIKLPLPEFNI